MDSINMIAIEQEARRLRDAEIQRIESLVVARVAVFSRRAIGFVGAVLRVAEKRLQALFSMGATRPAH